MQGQRIREVRISVQADPPSLGLTLQWTSISSTEDVWHILDVAPNSPADQAGLLPYGDYIIGTPEGIVRGEAGLGELVEDVCFVILSTYPCLYHPSSNTHSRVQHLSRPLDLHIYNHEYNLTRLLTITPSRHWGGSGALGCVLGYGALHRLPAPLQEPPQGPGETLFETVNFDPPHSHSPSAIPTSQSPDRQLQQNHLLIPADHLSIPTPPLNSTPTTTQRAQHKSSGRRQRHAAHGTLSPNRSMEEYFKEGEAKSREVDHAPGRATTGNSTEGGAGGVLPPPPKGNDIHASDQAPAVTSSAASVTGTEEKEEA